MTVNRSPALAILLALAACGPIVQVGGNAKAPAALLTLSAAAPASRPAAPPAPVDRAAAVSVLLPVVPGALQTLRIPVVVADTEIQYVKGGQWSEQPSRLFRRLVADKLADHGLTVIDPSVAGGSGSRQLSGQLAAFGVDMRGARPVVRVRYDATLATPGGIVQRRFEEEEPLAAVEPSPAAAALNRAANRVGDGLAIWVRDAAAAPAPAAGKPAADASH
jgi:cholesterol transport system auxiliary component